MNASYFHLMKYITTSMLALGLGLPFATLAQITITQANLPQPGAEWVIYSETDENPLFIPTPAGGNQTWNWTNALSTEESFTSQWASPGSFNGSGEFPSATLAIGDGDYAGFYRADATGLYTLGGNDGSRVQNGLVLPTPFTAGGNRTAAEVFSSLFFPGGGQAAYKFISHRTLIYTCDAWGTLSTPAFPGGVNVLRITQTEVAGPDSSFTDASGTGSGPWVLMNADEGGDVSVSYTFVQNGNPVMVAWTSDDGYAEYYAAGSGTSVPEQHVVETPMAFPVPSMDGRVIIRPNTKAAVRVEVLNALGEVLHSINAQGVDLIQLGTQGYAPGTYLFRCLDAAGTPVGQGRFIVGH